MLGSIAGSWRQRAPRASYDADRINQGSWSQQGRTRPALTIVGRCGTSVAGSGDFSVARARLLLGVLRGALRGCSTDVARRSKLALKFLHLLLGLLGVCRANDSTANRVTGFLGLDAGPIIARLGKGVSALVAMIRVPCIFGRAGELHGLLSFSPRIGGRGGEILVRLRCSFRAAQLARETANGIDEEARFG